MIGEVRRVKDMDMHLPGFNLSFHMLHQFRSRSRSA